MNNMNMQLLQSLKLLKAILENLEPTKFISQLLFSNVTETAGSGEQMISNIETVKLRMDNQAATVNESETTINEIAKTI